MQVDKKKSDDALKDKEKEIGNLEEENRKLCGILDSIGTMAKRRKHNSSPEYSRR